MEQYMSCGAEHADDEKDKDIDNTSHRVNEPEGKEYPEADTLSHSSKQSTMDDLILQDSNRFPKSKIEIGLPDVEPVPLSPHSDIIILDDFSLSRGESDSEIEGAIFDPWMSLLGGGRRRKNSNPISYSDLSYLNSLSRQERRRIEGEIINGRKLGEYIEISHITDHFFSGKHSWRNLTWNAKSIWVGHA
jgi:hypothetical protein